MKWFSLCAFLYMASGATAQKFSKWAVTPRVGMMRRLMMIMVLILPLVARSQRVIDSISVAETNEGRQVWGKSLDFDKKIVYLGTRQR